jgi:hypothetical protein
MIVKEHLHDGAIIAKARHMCLRHTDEQISDYLGMALSQVQTIRRNMPKSTRRGRPRRRG